MPSTKLTGSARSHVLAVLLCSLFLSLLTVSIMDVALPSIQREIGASSSQIQWALSGYALAVGVVLVAAGRAGDVLGRGRLFVIGTAIFAVGSTIATAAPDPLVLDIGRAIMGFGAGIYSPQVGGLIQQHYEGRERARAFGAFGATVGVAVAIGPTLGGLLLAVLPESLGWRATLGINVPVAIVVVILGLLWIPSDDVDPEARGRLLPSLDPLGAGVLGLSIVGIMLPFILTDGAIRWVYLACGVVGVALWWAWELHLDRAGGSPMVSPALLKLPTFTLGTLMIAIFFAGSTSLPVILALFVQQGMHQTPMTSGLIVLPMALAQIVSSAMSGDLVWKHGRKLVIAGVLLCILSIGALCLTVIAVSNGASVWLLAIPVTFLGFGSGWVTSPNQAIALRDVPVRFGGTASGVMQTGQRITTAIGIAACTGHFYDQVHLGYRTAFLASALIIICFEVAALIVAIIDQVRAAPAQPEDSDPAPSPKDAVQQALEDERDDEQTT